MMEKKKKEALQTAYRDACNAYLAAFAEKHGFGMADCSWVCDRPGEVALIGDYTASMEDMVVDVDNDAPKNEWFAWFDYSLECSELGMPSKCNYSSWLAGCPRYSKEKLEEIRSLHHRVEMAKKILDVAIRDAEVVA